MSNTSQSLFEDELFEHFRILIDPKQDPVRIDKFLIKRITDLTRTQIQDFIKSGWITVNLGKVKPNYKVKPNDEIIVLMPEPQQEQQLFPENIPPRHST